MKNFFIFFCIMVMGFSSCKKFLYQEPYNSLSLNDIFKDFEGARTTLVGCYDDLKGSDHYSRTFSIYPEVTGGNIKYSRPSNLALQISYNFNNDALVNDMSDFNKNAYSVIYGANNILANINKALDATTAQKNKLMADAFCIRALIHFDLVRVFAQGYSFTPDASHRGIVIRNFNVSALTPVTNINTCKQVFDQINSDLDSAILLYPNSVQIFTIGDAKTYFSLDAAKALQNRVSLYKNDWNKVISLSTDLIIANKYPLTTNGSYVSSWQTIATESIFELAFGNRTGGALGDYYSVSSSATLSQLATTTDLLNLFQSGDVRGQNSMFSSKQVNATTFFGTNKYQNISLGNNIKVLRMSEVYLNRAEAYAEINKLSEALADLNIIRKRANPAAANFNSTDKQIILDEIFNERRRELCFEGHLFFDISRKKKNLVRQDCQSTVCGFSYPDPRFACPIPLIN